MFWCFFRAVISTEICDMCVGSECPNYDMIVPLLFTDKLEDLPNKCKLTPGKSWWHITSAKNKVSK